MGVRKNSALKTLANELADTVATKTENIRHLKEVMKLLGTRVTELEKANKALRQGQQFAMALQNGKNGQSTHALCNGGGGGGGDEKDGQMLAKQTIIISKK